MVPPDAWPPADWGAGPEDPLGRRAGRGDDGSPDDAADRARALIEALVGGQRWEQALRALGPALAADPYDTRLLGLLVRTLRGLGRRTEAVDAAQRMLQVSPDDPYALRLATLVLVDVGWIDEAIGVAHRAVGADPHNAANHLALARAWAASGRPDAPARHLASAREAVLLEPNSIDAQVQIGAALAASGDVEGARAAYRAALVLDPGNPAALNNLAVLDLHSGDPAAAAKGLAAALAADPQGAVARRNLDAVAVRVLRRAGWWALMAPLPGLVLATLGHAGWARLAGVLALAAPPLAVWRFWRVLSRGQRIALRALPERLGLGSWGWPVLASVVGLLALVQVIVAPASVSHVEVGVYAAVGLYLALFRVVAAAVRPSWRSEVAARSARIRRGPGPGAR